MPILWSDLLFLARFRHCCGVQTATSLLTLLRPFSRIAYARNNFIVRQFKYLAADGRCLINFFLATQHRHVLTRVQPCTFVRKTISGFHDDSFYRQKKKHNNTKNERKTPRQSRIFVLLQVLHRVDFDPTINDPMRSGEERYGDIGDFVFLRCIGATA